ncbi:HdeD family acid-resistance protein [Ochrobactrum sp. CM-21-5]|nr:HdeD family acid-resistance protein [Ochrobactrum sp. CM-21-5]MBC2886242.1 HdeD family acid-resistance protein [Ochrobactrum sp. CM-21-5]
MATAHNDFDRPTLPAELSSKWGWFVALGIAMLILGAIAFGNLVLATVVSVYYVGLMMLIAGVIEIIHAFGVKTWGSFFFWLLSGLLYAAAGIVAFVNPVLAAGVLTFLLAATLLGSGAFRIWLGFKSKPSKGWGWIVAAGVVTMLAGLVIAMQWPVNSLFILGLFLAIDLIFQGWSFIAFGLGIRR